MSSTFCFICAILALHPIEMRSNRIRIREYALEWCSRAGADATLHCPLAGSNEMAAKRPKVLAPSHTHPHSFSPSAAISRVERQLSCFSFAGTWQHSDRLAFADRQHCLHQYLPCLCRCALQVIGCLQTSKQIATAGYI